MSVREESSVSQLAIPRRAAGRLRERLSENLSRRFVGRDAEITLFKDVLNSGQAALLWVYGPGGVGKSTLLHRLAQLPSDKGMPVLFPDARDLPPTQEGVVQGLRQALEPAIVSVEDEEQRWVILLDTCEHFSEAEASAVRTEVLSQLPATSLIVLAARARPGLAWLTDPGWGELLTPMPLHNLSPTEARTYLSRAGVPESRHDAVVAFTHGHPLSLALVGELGKHADFDPSGSPDVLGSLLERLLSDVPGPSYRDAVYASAQVRVTDEGLLAVLLDGDVTAEFDWLRRQPYMESGLDGVFPHDLARDLLDKDLRWRNPQRQRVLHERAGRYYLRLMEVGDTEVQQSALFDLMALHPSLRGFLLAPSAALRVTRGASADRGRGPEPDIRTRRAGIGRTGGSVVGPGPGCLGDRQGPQRPGSIVAACRNGVGSTTRTWWAARRGPGRRRRPDPAGPPSAGAPRRAGDLRSVVAGCRDIPEAVPRADNARCPADPSLPDHPRASGLVRADRRSRHLVGAHDLHRPEPDARGRLHARRRTATAYSAMTGEPCRRLAGSR